MTVRPAVRRVLLVGTTLLLIALAWGTLAGGLRQLPRSLTAGQQAETAVQLACGLLSLLAVLTCFRWRRWATPVRAAWAVCLVAAAGLSSLVWGPPLPLTALLFAAGALILALGIIWALRKVSSSMNATRISFRVNAPRAAVYRALIDAHAVATWMVPDGMTSHIHEFDARVGGAFRISLTYDEPTGTGKTSSQTDTFHGRFLMLVDPEQVVEVVEFETADPSLRGEMTITITLADAAGATDILAVHEGLPPGLSPASNELGWRMSLGKLARLVESTR